MGGFVVKRIHYLLCSRVVLSQFKGSPLSESLLLFLRLLLLLFDGFSVLFFYFIFIFFTARKRRGYSIIHLIRCTYMGTSKK